jgi:hypothetical protein
MRTGYWSLFVPSQAVGASKVYFDLFNGSERAITVSSLKAIKDGSVAITGTLAVKLHLTRTSAEGTGGTEATEDGTSLTAATISKLQRYALPDGITARLTPSGGATADAVICERQIFAEETSAVSYDAVEFLPCGLIVPEGTGIRVVQGAIAATGNIGFSATFY